MDPIRDRYLLSQISFGGLKHLILVSLIFRSLDKKYQTALSITVILSPEGNLRKQVPNGVHLSILCFIQSVSWRVLEMSISATETKLPKCFIPLRESAKADILYGVHLSILCFIQSVRWRVLEMSISAIETKMQKCFFVWMDGWMDGWMGGWWSFTPFDFRHFQVW